MKVLKDDLSWKKDLNKDQKKNLGRKSENFLVFWEKLYLKDELLGK